MRTLLFGTAAPDFVTRCIQALPDDEEVTLWSSKDTLDTIKNADISKQSLGYDPASRASVPTLVMLWRFLLLRPQKVVVVCGNTFYHENILAFVYFLKRLTRTKCTIYHYSLDSFHKVEKPDQDIESTYSLRPMLVALLCAVLLLGLAAWISPMLALALATAFSSVEIALRLKERAKRHAKGPISNWPSLRRLVPMPTSSENPSVVTYQGILSLPDREDTRTYRDSSIKTPYGEHAFRVTSNKPLQLDKPVILVMGCSQSYGLSVDDDKTYAWILQERFPDHTVINVSRSAASPCDMLVILKNCISTLKPEFVLFGFWDGLEDRNIRFGRSSADIVNGRLKIGYRRNCRFFLVPELPLLINKRYNDKIVERLHPLQKQRAHEIQYHVFNEFQRTCAATNSHFIVCNLNSSPNYHEFLLKNHFNWCIAELNWHINLEDGYLLPFDVHINERSHAVVAESITRAINEIRESGSCKPDYSLIRIKDTDKIKSDDPHIYQHF